MGPLFTYICLLLLTLIQVRSQFCTEPASFPCCSEPPCTNKPDCAIPCDGTRQCALFVGIDDERWRIFPNVTCEAGNDTGSVTPGMMMGNIGCNEVVTNATVSIDDFHVYTFQVDDILQDVEITTCGSSFDTQLTILYENPSDNMETELFFCNDCQAGCDAGNNAVNISLRNGIYDIVVDGDGDSGPYILSLACLSTSSTPSPHYMLADVNRNDKDLKSPIEFTMDVSTEFADTAHDYTIHTAFQFVNGTCRDPTVTFVHEVIDLGEANALRVYTDYYLVDEPTNVQIGACPALGINCGTFETCLDNVAYPGKTTVMDEVLYLTIFKSKEVTAVCDLFSGHSYSVLGNLTVSCTVPTPMPTSEPTMEPTMETQPPTGDPTLEPTVDPTIDPTIDPTLDPTMDPTSDPTIDPTSDPTKDPTIDPTSDPTTSAPTMDPTVDPTNDPTIDPTIDPTFDPTVDPTKDPTIDPTSDPTNDPTSDPTVDPTIDPTNDPTNDPTSDPTLDPTIDPTTDPSIDPTSDPTTDPTKDPTSDPTFDPTVDPTIDPSIDPTSDPTIDPTNDPTFDPTIDPTVDPSSDPTNDPTVDPTTDPTLYPSISPTYYVNWREFKGITCYNLGDSYEEEDNLTEEQCFNKCWNDDDCVGVVFYEYFRPPPDDDSRCYLYNGYCYAIEDDTKPVTIAFWDNTNYQDFDLNCVDYPFDWKDAYNDDCTAHNDKGWCQNLFGSDSTILDDADATYGLNAIQTCCDCDGGLYIYEENLLLESIWKPSSKLDINQLITCQTFNDGSLNDRLDHALSIHQWELNEFLNICNFFQNELYQQYRILYSLSDEQNEDLMNEDFIQLMQLSCFEALYFYEVIICDTSDNDYWAFIVDTNSTKMWINSNYINITDFESWYNYKQDSCDISSIIDNSQNQDNLMSVLLCDLVNITIPPTTTTEITTTSVSDECDFNAKNVKRFVFTIVTLFNNDDIELQDEMKDICMISLRRALVIITGSWNQFWCFILSFFDITASSSSNRRLLQENTIDIEVDFTFNDALQAWFDSADYDETTFLDTFVEQIGAESVLRGIINNETDISELLTISISTTEMTEKITEDKSTLDKILDTNEPLFWIILFGIVIVCLLCGVCIIFIRLRTVEKKQKQAIQLGTLHGATGELHITPSYNRDGAGASYHTALSANSPSANTPKGLFTTHEAYDTIDIADQIAADMRENKMSPIPEPETDAEDSVNDLL